MKKFIVHVQICLQTLETVKKEKRKWKRCIIFLPHFIIHNFILVCHIKSIWFFFFFLRCCYEFPKRDEVEGAWILLWSLTGSQRMCFICLFFLVVTLISLPTMMRMPQQTEQTSLAGSIFPYFLTHLSAAISVSPKLPWKANPSQHSKCYVAALTSTVSNWLLLSFPFISKLVPNHSITQVWQFPWFWSLLFLSPFFFFLT